MARYCQAIHGHQAIHGWPGPSADGLGPSMAPNISFHIPPAVARVFHFCPFTPYTTTLPLRLCHAHTSSALQLADALFSTPSLAGALFNTLDLKFIWYDATATDCLPLSLCLPFGLHSPENRGTPTPL